MSFLPKTESVHIREVWSDNLEDEFALIREIVDQYPYIAMDTEFPGIVLRPVGNFKNSNEKLKENFFSGSLDKYAGVLFVSHANVMDVSFAETGNCQDSARSYFINSPKE
ncbi:hypothetical protein SAY87_005948 [Trapa incisa]|uniref:Uncharacterized protein n=1 Tax=Trapa incisa TaxID=236973 RepID=A0AAN7K5L5_9MYRT|nr:hypothetical protein SAY87_005948 [Trapa incisa]